MLTSLKCIFLLFVLAGCQKSPRRQVKLWSQKIEPSIWLDPPIHNLRCCRFHAGKVRMTTWRKWGGIRIDATLLARLHPGQALAVAIPASLAGRRQNRQGSP
jgi:hypothetical protein